MDSSPGTIQILALFICSFGAGAVVITAIVVDRLRAQAILISLYSVFGAALFVFGNIADPHQTSQKTSPEPGVNLALIANNIPATMLVAAFAILFAARLVFSAKPQWRDYLRKFLIPRLWDTSSKTAEITEDVERRWYVTVAAATGNVIGIRIIDAAAVQTFRDSLTFDRLFIIAVISAIAFVLVGPGEEILLGAAANVSPGHSPSRSPFEQLLHNTSSSGWAKWIGFFVALFFINVGEKCMDDALSSGHAQSALQMLLAAAPAGVVTYYWCAGIQRSAKTVTEAVFVPSFLFSMFLFAGAALFIAGMATHAGYLAAVPKHGTPLALAVGVLLGIILTILIFVGFAILNLCQYGLTAAFGGMSIDLDREKPDRSGYVTVLKVIGTVMVIQFLTIGAIFKIVDTILSFQHLKLSDEAANEALLSILGTLIWGLGLVIARFPKVLERGRKPAPHRAATEAS